MTKGHLPRAGLALGAAHAAGLSVGYWADRSVLRSHWHRASQWRSSMTAEHRQDQFSSWRKAVELAIEWGRRPAAGD